MFYSQMLCLGPIKCKIIFLLRTLSNQPTKLYHKFKSKNSLTRWIITLVAFPDSNIKLSTASPGTTVKLCLGDWLVMDLNPETTSLHM